MSAAAESHPQHTAEAVEKWAAAAGKRRSRYLLYWSAGLISVGLVIQLTTLYWNHPVAFLIFLGAGASLTGLGMLLFIWALIRALSR